MPSWSVTGHFELAEHPSSSDISPYTGHDFPHEEVYQSVTLPHCLLNATGTICIKRICKSYAIAVKRLMMNGAHLPLVDVSKIIRDQPASPCHAISSLFGAAQTERGDAQRSISSIGFQNTSQDSFNHAPTGTCRVCNAKWLQIDLSKLPWGSVTKIFKGYMQVFEMQWNGSDYILGKLCILC